MEAPPPSRESWELVLATIKNSLANEQDASGTTPAKRFLGRSASRLRNIMDDSPATANQTKDDCIETKKHTREIYNQTYTDGKTFRLLSNV